MIPEELAARRAFVRQMLAEKGKLERALMALDATLLSYTASFGAGREPTPEPAPPPPVVAQPPPDPEPVPEQPVPRWTTPTLSWPDPLPPPVAQPVPDPEPVPEPAPPPEPPAPPEPAPGPHIGEKRFYPARNDIIVREWPRGTSVNEILAMLHELPGLEVSPNHVGVHATRLGVRRPMKGLAPHEAVRQQVSAVPPVKRMDALRDVFTTLAPRRPMPHGEPVLVNFEQIRRWAGERGMQFLTWEDLPRINAKRDDLGQPAFKRDFRR